MNTILHAQFSGSLIASPDVIGLAGDVSSHAVTLRSVSRSIAFEAASGAEPSEAILREIEGTASDLLRCVEAYRLARAL